MRIIVDASALIAVIANEPAKDSIIEATQGAELIAPPSVHWEIGNAFSSMLKRKLITGDQALKCLEIYRQIPIHFEDVELDESLRLAAELNIYAYDAYLLRCALKYSAPILTLDKRMRFLAKQKFIDIREVSA
ncbi:MAG: type II toxin-antitoxin system VapC family toxin [Desulfobacterales bacterium]